MAYLISFRPAIHVGSHAYSLITLGYFVPDDISDDITGRQEEIWVSLVCTNEVKFFVFVTLSLVFKFNKFFNLFKSIYHCLL